MTPFILYDTKFKWFIHPHTDSDKLFTLSKGDEAYRDNEMYMTDTDFMLYSLDMYMSGKYEGRFTTHYHLGTTEYGENIYSDCTMMAFEVTIPSELNHITLVDPLPPITVKIFGHFTYNPELFRYEVVTMGQHMEYTKDIKITRVVGKIQDD